MSERIDYIYTDKKGIPLYRQTRIQNGKEKTFRSSKFVNNKWVNGLKDVDRVLYNLPSVIKAVEKAQKIYFVEGEKNVETLKEKGLVATTIAGRRRRSIATRLDRHFIKCRYYHYIR